MSALKQPRVVSPIESRPAGQNRDAALDFASPTKVKHQRTRDVPRGTAITSTGTCSNNGARRIINEISRSAFTTEQVSASRMSNGRPLNKRFPFGTRLETELGPMFNSDGPLFQTFYTDAMGIIKNAASVLRDRLRWF